VCAERAGATCETVWMAAEAVDLRTLGCGLWLCVQRVNRGLCALVCSLGAVRVGFLGRVLRMLAPWRVHSGVLGWFWGARGKTHETHTL